MTSLGLRWQSIVDFVVLVAAIYFVLRWSREARALRVTLGILALEAGALIARQVHLTITVWVLHAGALVAAVILIVIFQPELRHALKRLEIVLARPARGVEVDELYPQRVTVRLARTPDTRTPLKEPR